MNLFGRMRSWITRSKKDKYAGNSYDFSKWFEPRNIFQQLSSNTLATNETIFAAVSRLSNSMASLPIKLRKEYESVSGVVADLLSTSPNENMTAFEFIRILETHRNINGNGYAIKMYDQYNQVESLHILDPTRVAPVIEARTGELWYEVQGENGRYYVHNMDMIHVRHIYFGTGFKGISPIDVLKNTINFDSQVRQFSLDSMDGAIKTSFILKMSAQLDEDKRKEAIESFKRFYRENGGVLIEQQGTEIDSIEREFIDTKVFEVEKITKNRVAMVYNLPVHMLGETDGINYSSMEQMALEFVQFTLTPICRQYEQEFARKVLTKRERQEGYEFKFNLNALLRGDIKTRGEFYFRGIRSSWFTPNDVRALEDLPPAEGGDQLYISKDLIPLNKVGSEEVGK